MNNNNNMITRTQTIAQLNDQGAKFLMEGNHRDAIHMLKQCSSEIKTLLKMYAANGGSWGSSSSSSSSSSSLSQQLYQQQQQQDFLYSSSSHHHQQQQQEDDGYKLPVSSTKFQREFSSGIISELQHPEFFIYNRPYLLTNVLHMLLDESSSTSSSTIGDEAIMRVCSAASIFNMALSFHTRAIMMMMNGGNCWWNTIVSAEKLYLSVLGLLMNDDDSDHDDEDDNEFSTAATSVDEVFFLIIATANNLSHIRLYMMAQHHQQQQQQQGGYPGYSGDGVTAAAVQSLTLFQNCILPTLTQGGERLQCISQSEWEIFCLNMYVLSRSKSLVAAPAA